MSTDNKADNEELIELFGLKARVDDEIRELLQIQKQQNRQQKPLASEDYTDNELTGEPEEEEQTARRTMMWEKRAAAAALVPFSGGIYGKRAALVPYSGGIYGKRAVAKRQLVPYSGGIYGKRSFYDIGDEDTTSAALGRRTQRAVPLNGGFYGRRRR